LPARCRSLRICASRAPCQPPKFLRHNCPGYFPALPSARPTASGACARPPFQVLGWGAWVTQGGTRVPRLPRAGIGRPVGAEKWAFVRGYRGVELRRFFMESRGARVRSKTPAERERVLMFVGGWFTRRRGGAEGVAESWVGSNCGSRARGKQRVGGNRGLKVRFLTSSPTHY
jgi:hypothetical protein